MAVSSWLLILVSLALTFSHDSAAASLSKDASSLLAFKTSISLDPSHLLRSWNPSTPHCLWYGVHCDPVSRRVTSLTIPGKLNSPKPSQLAAFNFTPSDSVLVGSLPTSIGNLTKLRTLSLPHHLLSGEIPAAIRRLGSLQVLQLQGNNFSGAIPPQLRYLSSLRLLNLSYNALSEPIPDRLIGYQGRLSVIDLSNNQLSGALSIYKYGKCEFLNYLRLSNNFLVDDIPVEIGRCSNLRTLLLDGNIFEGLIPAEIGRISELEILDVSRNSLTGSLPNSLAHCRKLSVLVLTSLVDFGYYSSTVDGGSLVDVYRGEFNAFEGGIPSEILLLPNLKIFWAPRANLGGRLPDNWTDLCLLRVLNLGQNYFTGALPESMIMCRNLTFLDLSSNGLGGYLPSQLRVPCMEYFNVSRNSLSGVLPRFENGSCDSSLLSLGLDTDMLWGTEMNALLGGSSFVISHDFSWNSFFGPLPSFSVGDELVLANVNASFRLLLNNNKFNGSLPHELFSSCNQLQSFSVNMSANQLSGGIYVELLLNCLNLNDFEAVGNQIVGSIPPEIGSLKKLKRLELSKNRLSGSLPDQLGELKDLKRILLGENNLTGSIPAKFSQLTSLVVLDLSQNDLTGHIPATLANDAGLEILLLDHNKLSGEIPSSFSNLANLTQLDLSFNNLSGHIPRIQQLSNCDAFKGNYFLYSCPDQYSEPPARLPVPLEVQKRHGPSKLRSFTIAMAISASVVFSVLVVIVLVLILGKRKLSRLTSLRRKVVVTFVDAPTELTYDNVVGSTGNFSIRNLIGTGGFGSTYKAEVIPGFLVAVKRLSIGRFHGNEQFDAEIRTLGRIRHKNLVTLIGYHVSETEMFLVYNYLSGGNLETFIHDRSGQNADVYSFGVVLLELISGKKSLDPSFSEFGNGFNIVAWAKLLMKEGRSYELFRPELWESGPKENLLGMLRLASACTLESLSVRPLMKQVLEKLKQFHPEH
ncbi:hypothetical protein RJ639_028909 [Escallonia herrerae]|uniref:non-specific serine/threonine protein kinase n=1 Tax=Escallonia herrerae TaxID=1293975 RepID=A0AA89BFM9_9ASTE|nr:hypothetical protein RJ639_028909 [Escallonia herrerae]